MSEKNKQLLILIGIPASGKSTWAKSYIKNNRDWVRVNRDSFRLMLREEQMCEPKVEEMISSLVRHSIRESLLKNLNVMLDNTNLHVGRLQELMDEFKYYADVNFRVFDISLEKAIERDNARTTDKVGEEVIKKMYKNYQILTDTFHFNPVKQEHIRERIQPDWCNPLPNAVIFDIDGTLANTGDRGIYDVDKAYRDHIVDLVAEQVEYHRGISRKIIILSGRDDTSLPVTKDWLDLHCIVYDEIFMRKTGDYRKDSVVKKEIYDTLIKPNYNVICAYDDRHQVLDMWYKEKIFTFNVNQGNHVF